ncbi:MAG: topoisomerase C-terminal repeat-containing protein, partial [Pseudomonadota bacterium]
VFLINNTDCRIFYACSNYPTCKTTEPYSSDKAKVNLGQQDNNKIIGKFDDEDVWLKKGPYGYYFQLGEGKNCKRSALPKFVAPEEANLEQAIRLFSLPLTLGEHPKDQKLITLNTGRFGPFIAHDQKFFSLKKKEEIFTIDLQRALNIIDSHVN